jgi:hypothetical protein
MIVTSTSLSTEGAECYDEPASPAMMKDTTIGKLSQSTRSPDRLGVEDVLANRLNLIPLKRSWSLINQTAGALWFFHDATLGRREAFERIVSAAALNWML